MIFFYGKNLPGVFKGGSPLGQGAVDKTGANEVSEDLGTRGERPPHIYTLHFFLSFVYHKKGDPHGKTTFSKTNILYVCAAGFYYWDK